MIEKDIRKQLNMIDETTEFHQDPVVTFASLAHEQWRRNFNASNSSGTTDPSNPNDPSTPLSPVDSSVHKPRIKKNSDGTEGDINQPFNEIHPDWQKENLAAGEAALEAVKRFPDDEEKAAEFIHIQWMRRNPKADYNAAQHVPYDELLEEEKEKDRVHVRVMKKILT